MTESQRNRSIFSTPLIGRVGIFCLPVADPTDTHAGRTALTHLMGDIQLAERHGLGFAWIAEHHGRPYGGCIPDPLTFIAAVGQIVDRISLGSCITLTPLRHPMLIAQQAQLVSRLIRSPLHVGLGKGFLPSDIQDFGLSHHDAQSKFWAAVEYFASIHSDAQWPNDVWVATTSAAGAETTGRFGLGLALNPYTRTASEVDTSIAAYQKSIRKSGLEDRYRVLIHEPLFLASSTAEAVATGVPNFLQYLDYLKASERPATESVEKHHVLGDHDYTSRGAFLAESAFPDHLTAWQTRGVTHWCFLMRFGDLLDSEVEETLTRCARSLRESMRTPTTGGPP